MEKARLKTVEKTKPKKKIEIEKFSDVFQYKVIKSSENVEVLSTPEEAFDTIFQMWSFTEKNKNIRSIPNPCRIGQVIFLQGHIKFISLQTKY